MKIVPFHSNQEDNLHCMQACVKSILGFYNVDYKIEDIDKNTGFFGVPSWSPHTVNWLNKKGLNAKLISPFKYNRLSTEGENYLREFKGNVAFEKEKSEGQYDHLDEVKKASEEMVINGFWENRKLNIPDLASFLDDDFHLAIAKTMNTYLFGIFDVSGNSHYVTVIKQYKPGEWLIHDSGYPPKERRKVPQTMITPESNSQNIFGDTILIALKDK